MSGSDSGHAGLPHWRGPDWLQPGPTALAMPDMHHSASFPRASPVSEETSARRFQGRAGRRPRDGRRVPMCCQYCRNESLETGRAPTFHAVFPSFDTPEASIFVQAPRAGHRSGAAVHSSRKKRNTGCVVISCICKERSRQQGWSFWLRLQ